MGVLGWTPRQMRGHTMRERRSLVLLPAADPRFEMPPVRRAGPRGCHPGVHRAAVSWL